MNGNLLGYFLRLAFRNLQASRWMTVLIAVTLGIGIGASMLSLSLLHVLSADPIPSKSERLFQVTPFAKHGRIAPAAAFTYRDAVSLSSDTQARLVILAAGLSTFRSTQTDTAPPRQVRVRYTTRHFFDLFDAPFLAGSTWGDREDADGAPVAVLSNELAQEGFADAGAIGSSFRLGGVTFRVIGVLAPWRPAPRYYDLSIGAYAPADDVYIPLNAIKNLNDSAFASFSCPPGAILPGSATAARLPTSNCVWLTAWTQLDDEHKQQSFRRFLDNYLAAQQHDGRMTHIDKLRLLNVAQVLQHADVVPADIRIYSMLTCAFLMLCIVNATGILLAKFLARGEEIGIRRALGATRGAIFGQMLVEAGLVGICGGAIGLATTLLGLNIIRHLPKFYADLAHMDRFMFTVLSLVAVGSGLAAGAFPAWRASRIEPALQIKNV